jgi:hypothetical protein
MGTAVNVGPSPADMLRRLAQRTDLPVEVVATLYSAAELSLLREHDAYNCGFTDGVNRTLATQRGEVAR